MKYLVAIFLLAVVSVAVSEPECGPNELYKECGYHPLCVPACDYTPGLCPPICISGCFCKPGYIKRSRDDDAECIPISQCWLSTLHKIRRGYTLRIQND